MGRKSKSKGLLTISTGTLEKLRITTYRKKGSTCLLSQYFMFFKVAICRKMYSEVCIVVNNLYFIVIYLETMFVKS